MNYWTLLNVFEFFHIIKITTACYSKLHQLRKFLMSDIWIVTHADFLADIRVKG